MRKISLLLGLIVLLIGQLAAQDHVVKGTITDANGAPIAGASVTIKGSNRGTSTATDGTFSISVPNSAKTLIISAVNYDPVQVNAAGRSTVGAVSLKLAGQSLNEVVVVAYGTQKKVNVTGAIVTVGGGQIADKPFASVDNTLQGAAPGLQVSAPNGIPGSAVDIRIRGIGTITGDASPLWIIDGNAATTGDQAQSSTSTNALSGINPDDIESISILKDAAATSLYGSRGANGVILVTTKRGKQGKTRINFNTEVGRNSVGFSNKNNHPMTTPEYHSEFQTAIHNYDPTLSAADIESFITDPNNGYGLPSNWASTNTDWLHLVTRTGNQQQYNLSMSGGNEKTQWFASGGYFNQDGTTIATNFKRYNGNINVTSKLNEKITFSAGIQGSYSNQIAPPGSAAYASPVSGAFFLPPFYSPYNTDGSLRYGPDHDSLNEFPAGAQFNPLAIAQWNRYTDAQTQFRGFVSGEYQIIPNLKFTSRYSAEYLDYNEYVYWNPIYGDGYPLGYGDASNTKIYGWTWTNQLNYKVNLNKEKDFYLDLLAATEAYEKNTFVLNAQGNNFPSTTLLTYLTSAASPIGAFTVPTSNSLISYFSNAALNYKDRYVLTGSFRRDGASIWAQGHQWGNFYSVGGTWNINEEEFMSTLPVFSLLKLRASYGTQGNSAGFGNYTSIPTYGFSTAYRGNAGSNPNNVGNPLLTWETNKEFNVGLDWGLLKNRISGTIEYYKRTTDGLVLNVPLSPTSGFASQNQNVGSMYNQGIEFSITGKPVVTRDFTWTSSFNISHNKNRVTKLYNHVPVSQQTRFDVTEGHDVREFYTRLWANANPANGNPQWYTDATKKTITSTSSQVSLSLTGKSASPKYYGAWTNTFTYKGFSLEAQLYYNFGNYIYSTWENYLESDGLYLGNTGQLSNSLRGWKKAGDVTPVPAQIAGGNMNSNVPSTRYLYKGNYIRLRDVQLDYSIPKSAISKANITNITVYVRGTNLLTFATDKYLAFDPEIGASSIGDFQVFMPKTISAGVKLGF